ncbi:protein kinase domain-containing protein [Crateriforma conspicua]|uniref:Serine/threonine-protein kinase PknD n=1 Tax=Crateriforma conspicua TaxID=2527996 RepID=A0A5C6FTT9_9PLAN|nr:protein kinase [Crateriforma conspicua]TWU64898.1 Serine/threonine-protein kinase PknD [Crateriforma conspicua]
MSRDGQRSPNDPNKEPGRQDDDPSRRPESLDETVDLTQSDGDGHPGPDGQDVSTPDASAKGSSGAKAGDRTTGDSPASDLDRTAKLDETVDLDATTRLDETVGIDPDAGTESSSEEDDLDATKSIDETVDFSPAKLSVPMEALDETTDLNATRRIDETVDVASAATDSTDESDPNATKRLDETVDLDATKRIDETVDLDATKRLDETAGSETVMASGLVDPSDENRTVDLSSDATAELDAPDSKGDPHSGTVDFELGVDDSRSDQSTMEYQDPDDVHTMDVTLDSLVVDPADDADGQPSVLEDDNLGQTISPRQLSEEEQDFWGQISAEFVADDAPTKMKPAIDRSISEQKLALNKRHMVTPMQDDDQLSDYRLIRLLGKGGMGNVFVARQGSLDRLLAVKVIRPLDKAKRSKLRKQGKLKQVEEARRQQFLSEAVVTGDLDHPNIVPIHDVAVTGDNTVFYAMKRVVGTPWSDVIGEKTLDENLEILLRASDAIGFAHTRGVVHRDIKPENIMLGDFGVVLVMDWGLALAKPEFEKLDSITPSHGLGGTPSFMAPELAVGPVDRIGPAADIYLLGATLFMIITGNPPHNAANVSLCLRAVASNEIRPFDDRFRGELMDIALKAMATNPADRYPDVPSFQDAIRQYRDHAESIILAKRAKDDLQRAGQTEDYSSFARAEFGFEEALVLWEGNRQAKEGLSQARVEHAEAAYRNRDFDLGLSLLSENDPDHVDLIKRLKDGIRERELNASRLAVLKKAAAAMLAFILVGGAVAIYLIDQQRGVAEHNANLARENEELARANAEEARSNAQVAETKRLEAEAARQEAIEAREQAEKAKDKEAIARGDAERARDEALTAKQNEEEQKRIAVEEKNNAVVARNEAVEARRETEQARRLVEQEYYRSQIGLAKARVDQNEFDEARRIVDELIEKRRREGKTGELPIELQWLSDVTQQAAETVQLDSPAEDLSMSKNASHFAVALADGRVVTLDRQGQQLRMQPAFATSQGDVASDVAIAEDGNRLLVGTELGTVDLMDRSQGRPKSTGSMLRHNGPVTESMLLSFPDRRDEWILSAGTDRTIRVLSGPSQDQTSVLWHLAPVVAFDAVVRESDVLVAAAIADQTMGRIVLWSIDNDGTSFERVGVFDQHESPVTDVCLTRDGSLVASGDQSGVVLIWDPKAVAESDLASEIKQAVQGLAPEIAGNAGDMASVPKLSESKSVVPSARLVDPDVGFGREDRVQDAAHDSKVLSVSFSDDGQQLVTSGDDYLVKLWRVQASDVDQPPVGQFQRSFRGHGGAVVAAEYWDEGQGMVISASQDMTLRLWDLRKPSVEPMRDSDDDQASARSNRTFRTLVSQVSKKPSNSDGDSNHHTGSSGLIQVQDDAIWAARFSPTSDRIVTAGRDRTARLLSYDQQSDLWVTDDRRMGIASESDDAALVTTLRLDEGTDFRAMAMAFDRRYGRLIVGAADAMVRLWDLKKGTELTTASGTGIGNVVAVSRDGRRMVTASSSKNDRALIWEIPPGQGSYPRVIHRLGGHQESVSAVAISDDGKTLLTGDRAGRLIQWDCDSGNPVGEPWDDRLGLRIHAIAFAANGTSAWIATDDGAVSRWDLASRQVVQTYARDGAAVGLSLSPDKRFLAVVTELAKVDSVVHQVVLVDSVTGASQVLTRLEMPRDAESVNDGRPGIVDARFDDSDGRLAVLVTPRGDEPSQVDLWHVQAERIGDAKSLVDNATFAQRRERFELPMRLPDPGAVLPISPNQLLTLHGSAAFLWDCTTYQHVRSYRSHGAITDVAFSADSTRVATASRSVKIWDVETGRAVAKLESPHEGAVRCLQFGPASSPDVLVTGGDDGRVRRWKYRESDETLELTDAGQWSISLGRPLALTFSADGRRLLVTTDRGKVVVRDIVSKKTDVLMDTPQAGAVLCGRFSADGRWVACGGADRLVRMWPVPGINDVQWRAPIVFRGHAESVEGVVFHGNEDANLRLLSVSDDESLRIWDPMLDAVAKDPTSTEGRELIEIRRHNQPLTDIDISPDQKHVLTTDREGRISVWSMNP